MHEVLERLSRGVFLEAQQLANVKNQRYTAVELRTVQRQRELNFLRGVPDSSERVN